MTVFLEETLGLQELYSLYQEWVEMVSTVHNSNPKVLILSTNSDEAGAPVHVYILIFSLLERVNFVAIFGEDGPIAKRVRELGVPVEIVPEMRSAINPILDLSALNSISRLVSKYKPDLIHAHSSKAGMLGRVISFKYKLPCIYTVHGWGWRGFGISKRITVFLIEKILSFIPRTSFIYVSKSVEREAWSVLFLARSRGEVVHNGVFDLLKDHGVFLNDSPLKIIMPARVSSAKDHTSLLKAFNEFQFPSQLFLCGGGTDSHEFINYAKQIALKRFDDIFFLGLRSDIPELLSNADIFALISNFEALPISIIEAMSAGKAIIASDVGGVRELIDDKISGLCVQKNNHQSILIALNKFSDAKFRKKCGVEARRKYLLNFTAQFMANKIFISYSAALTKQS